MIPINCDINTRSPAVNDKPERCCHKYCAV